MIITSDHIPEGFIITAKNLAVDPGAEQPRKILPEQLGEQIAIFLRTRLEKQPAIRVSLSIEHWDLMNELAVTNYEVKADLSTTRGKDYTRNYWVENQ
ncbi:hypothetical protein GCM10023149_29440 [Mucilaginibacter gynuensis]|uniref:Uncharacterized protein n=1 Tax=Mucilaginibacter gynuensis TaxID=1302236 RepID=A0ABP8GLJ2_9SPHI